MTLNKITSSGRNKSSKRVGRGSSAGGGKTAGRGTKGQKARTGGGIPAYFEGGQMPFIMRLKKKKGFRPHKKAMFFLINLRDLDTFAKDGTLTYDSLLEQKHVEPGMKIKILGTGELTKPLTISAHFVSAQAKSKIEAAGGTIELIK